MSDGQPRALALHALRAWRTSGRFADSILHGLLGASSLIPADRAFATELVYGVLRNLSLLDFWLRALRDSRIDHAARDLVRLGLYQLLILGSAEHAAVFETVALAPQRARGLVNAILRAAQNRRADLLEAARGAGPSIRFSHPQFLIDRWTRSFGEAVMLDLCAWNNQPPPIYARVNRLNAASAQFGTGHERAERANFVRLVQVDAEAIARGECYIQDPSTAMACELLAPRPNESILDACAAPGGKTGYLAELLGNSGHILATDRDAPRLATLRENLRRLGVTNTEVACVDWSRAESPTALREFDRILVDAPCSNTGVMRRRVDVRWRLTENDFARMQEQQLRILRRVFPLLKRNGVLVYSTCSIDAAENEDVVEQIVRELPEIALVEGRTLLPERDGGDGAFAAKFTRN